MNTLILHESLDGAECGDRESVGRGSSMLQPKAYRGAWLELGSVKVLILTAVFGLLHACSVGPDYVRPPVVAPATYKELKDWKVAQPKDNLNRGQWWEFFGDRQLSALEAQVDISNQNLQVAEAQFRQARALVQVARAAYFPTITTGAAVTRSQSSTTFSGRSNPVAAPFTDYSLSLDASWEIDVWGRVRRTVEANEAGAQASAADLAAARLSTQAELAQDYFQLRALDAQQQLLEDTVAAYEKSLQLTQNRYVSGVASKADVVLAETQLKTTQAQAIDIGVQRAQLEHAIALLVGQPASTFAIPVAPLATVPPAIPVGVPSALLERRPDIAAAERQVAAANAQIGVAEAAFYPALTLSAAGGYESSAFSQWFTLPSRFWSVGAALAETLFEGGLRQAQTEQARAAYDATVAAYRQTVLTGFQDVENNLAALRILEREAQVQEDAVKAAQQSVALTTNQYKAGIVSYLNVIVVQAIALNNASTAVGILGRRLVASVLLIKALGGGWNAAELLPANNLAGTDPRQPVHAQ